MAHTTAPSVAQTVPQGRVAYRLGETNKTRSYVAYAPPPTNISRPVRRYEGGCTSVPQTRLPKR